MRKTIYILLLAVCAATPRIALAADEMTGIWESQLGDRFELRNGVIKTRGAFGTYSGKQGHVTSGANGKFTTPMTCDLKVSKSKQMIGKCQGGKFVVPYEFIAFRTGE